jgi:hypothetical protein
VCALAAVILDMHQIVDFVAVHTLVVQKINHLLGYWLYEKVVITLEPDLAPYQHRPST